MLAFVHPHVDQDTRTVRVRFELKNPGHKLRPGSTATVELRIPPQHVPSLSKALAGGSDGKLAEGSSLAAERREKLKQGLVLAVPEGSVIDTGDQQIVYRETAPGEYEGVKVELGPRMTDVEGVTFYPLLGGLEQGDKIVTSIEKLGDLHFELS